MDTLIDSLEIWCVKRGLDRDYLQKLMGMENFISANTIDILQQERDAVVHEIEYAKSMISELENGGHLPRKEHPGADLRIAVEALELANLHYSPSVGIFESMAPQDDVVFAGVVNGFRDRVKARENQAQSVIVRLNLGKAIPEKGK